MSTLSLNVAHRQIDIESQCRSSESSETSKTRFILDGHEKFSLMYIPETLECLPNECAHAHKRDSLLSYLSILDGHEKCSLMYITKVLECLPDKCAHAHKRDSLLKQLR